MKTISGQLQVKYLKKTFEILIRIIYKLLCMLRTPIQLLLAVYVRTLR